MSTSSCLQRKARSCVECVMCLILSLCVQVPVWFCIACPIVLGLLAPFVFNLGFGAVAEAVCEHYQLPTEECNDLW